MHAGNLWPLVTVVAVILLGGAIAWAMIRNSRRDKRLDPVTEAATKAQYDPKGTSYRPPVDGTTSTNDGPSA